MTLRVACGVGCENNPLAVKIAPAAKITAKKPMRRFISSSFVRIQT
jgi:hypothetical protein